MPVVHPENVNANSMPPVRLNTLEVRNFRGFRHLAIEKLGRVNLITGKNNVGKSSLLEALLIYARRGDVTVLRSLLLTRDEFLRQSNAARVYEEGERDMRQTLETTQRFLTLFFGRPVTPEKASTIQIVDNTTLQGGIKISAERQDENQQGVLSDESANLLVELPSVESQLEIALKVKIGNKEIPYSSEELTGYRLARPRIIQDKNEIPVQYIRSSGVSEELIVNLWDRISLTHFEDEVVDSLKIIVDGIERISFIGDNRRTYTRKPFAKIKEITEPVPLKSFGEGTNRLFGLAVATVSIRNGILLVDEIENGLHYSILSRVWRLIFETARRLNIQVFATTHSWDCIQAFQEAAAMDEDPSSGVLIQLRRKAEETIATVYDEQDLAIITREGIEVR